MKRVPLLRSYPCSIAAVAGGSAPVPENHDDAWKPSSSKMKRAADEATYGGDVEKNCLGSSQAPNGLDEDRKAFKPCYICGIDARSPMRLVRNPECTFIACCGSHLMQLHDRWVDIKHDLLEMERSLPSGVPR